MRNQFIITWLTLALCIFSASQAQDELYKDATADVEDRIEDLLARMTLQEKIGQMIMDIENTPENAPGIGAYMIGAEGLGTVEEPLPNTIEQWRQRHNELQALSANNRLGIPLLIAADAVHGQNILSGATIFPHNIGLGATGNPSLIRQVAQATAAECTTSALDMAFAPTLAVAKTMTWGRTYESYSEDTDTVRSYVTDFIEGLQGEGVVATAKHWIGDGATTDGIDAGDTTLTEEDLLEMHGTPYVDAIAAGVGSIMISFSSVNGTQLHGSKYWVTTVLKERLGFDGIVLSDWEAYTRNPGDYDSQVRIAINAGLDMLMAPYQSYQIFETVTNSTNLGLISQDRIDDAVRRVLRVKFRAGLFEKKVDLIDVDTYQPIGTTAHRAIARQAVRESLVLLKNEGNVLPLSKTARIFLAGKTADNIQNQCGGWTMSWQGNTGLPRHQIVGGTTIRDGLESVATNAVTFNELGIGADPKNHDVAIVVVGELPYAEYEGDRDTLALNSTDQAAIANVQASGVPMILVVVSGRPMIITNEIKGVDTAVAAWLPGTEGDGIAEVLFGDYDFSGRLSFSWPANMAQITNGFVGDNKNVLFPFGYGLTYQDQSPTTTTVASPTATESQAPSDGVNTVAPSPMPSEAPDDSEPTALPTTSPTQEPTEPGDTTASPTTMSPSSSGGSLDAGVPTIPGTPVLSELTSTTVHFTWIASFDNVAVTQYDVYDGTQLVESTTSPSFAADDLKPNTAHSYTVVALDAAGNESPASDPLNIVTPLLVDDFDDGDNQAQDDWGQWRSAFDGTASDGMCTFETKVSGYEGLGARVVYSIDTGEWGFCNMYLDFDDGNTVDLTQSDITGVQFRMQGSPGTSFYLQLGTTLAEFNWKYYKYKLEPTDAWTVVTVLFDDFESDEGIPYTHPQAKQLATSLVWENSNVGQGGWFSIDDVDFVTSASQRKEPEATDTSSSRTNSVSVMIVLVSLGIMRW